MSTNSENTNHYRGYEAVIGIEVHVQLKTKSKIFCADSTRFDATDTIKGPEEYSFEFRLCNPLDSFKPYEINLKNHSLVVMDYSLPRIKKLILNETKQEETTLPVGEKTKLLKIIGSLAIFISKSSKKYMNGENPNISLISDAILKMFADMDINEPDIFDIKGMKATTLENAIKAGIKKLKDT